MQDSLHISGSFCLYLVTKSPANFNVFKNVLAITFKANLNNVNLYQPFDCNKLLYLTMVINLISLNVAFDENFVKTTRYFNIALEK